MRLPQVHHRLSLLSPSLPLPRFLSPKFPPRRSSSISTPAYLRAQSRVAVDKQIATFAPSSMNLSRFINLVPVNALGAEDGGGGGPNGSATSSITNTATATLEDEGTLIGKILQNERPLFAFVFNLETWMWCLFLLNFRSGSFFCP